MVKLFIDEVIV